MRLVRWRLLCAVVVAAIFGAIVVGVSSISSLEPKHYEITDAAVDVELQRDGSLIVSERLTFDFSGRFEGAYREFPLNGGAKVTDVSVAEGENTYAPGGNTALGSFDSPGTFGKRALLGSDFRIVWHYEAEDEVRTFDVVYRVENATAVHRDSVDVTWTIWGEQWDFWLDRLEATISARGGVAPIDAWVRPRSLGADPEVGDAASVVTERLPEGENAGMRAVFPREAITSTSGTTPGSDEALSEIAREEERLDDELGTFARLETFVSDNVLLLTLLTAGLALLGALIIPLLARERPSSAPEYLPEPPEDIPPRSPTPSRRRAPTTIASSWRPSSIWLTAATTTHGRPRTRRSSTSRSASPPIVHRRTRSRTTRSPRSISSTDC